MGGIKGIDAITTNNNTLGTKGKAGGVEDLPSKLLFHTLKLKKIQKEARNKTPNIKKGDEFSITDPVAKRLEESSDLTQPEKALLFSMKKKEQNLKKEKEK